MANVIRRLPTGRPKLLARVRAALPDGLAEEVGAVVPEGVVEGLPRSPVNVASDTKSTVTLLPLLQLLPGEVLEPATKFTIAHYHHLVLAPCRPGTNVTPSH